ncbi:hypothetical protein F4679DRAFT_287711 [Xylaria curta]|nr:hypothetical protein F4679DRAFT_287711 [Xylaria curta]
MPILRSLPPWPDPQESIRRQIPSSRVSNRMVWWPQGPALEIFEKFIQPEIENILKVVDLGHADLFIRLYMIGRKAESANPIVMVCCTNKKAREAAEATIRESGLLSEHKGFGLGRTALPLEHPAPVRRLSPNRKRQSSSVGSSKSDPSNIPSQLSSSATANLPFCPLPYTPINPSPENNSSPFIIDTLPSSNENNFNSGPFLFATSIGPLIGRCIFTSINVDHPYATAGVVIQVGESYYQLTAGHLFEESTGTCDEEESRMNLDECRFDGQSDDDEQDSDYELEITGRGSVTPGDTLSLSSVSTNQRNTLCYIRRGDDPSSTLAEVRRRLEAPKRPSLSRNGSLVLSDQEARHQRGNSEILVFQTQRPVRENSRVLTKVGCLPRGKFFQAPVDYAIITVSRNLIESLGWNINYIGQLRRRVKEIAEVGLEERNIVVATYSRLIKGVVIPGKVAYRNLHAQFERLIQIKLKSEVFEGDSGSTVIDKSTGSFYGHIVMGVPGTKMAYIAQAVDVFRDIEARIGKPVRIFTKEETHIRALPFFYNSLQCQDSFKSSRYSSGISAWSRSSAASNSRLEAPNIHVDSFTAGLLPCEFIGYTGCEQTFAKDDVDSWIEHIISTHLQENLPKIAVCWFCDNWIFDSRNVDDRRTNFENRMWHIRAHILDDGLTAHHMRPDHFLNTHLHKHRLVPDHAYHSVRRYAEVPQGNWILPYDGVPKDWEYKAARGDYEVNGPLEEQRKHRKQRHKSGNSRELETSSHLSIS